MLDNENSLSCLTKLCLIMKTCLLVLFLRDTTVQTLTLQSTVREGIIIYEDSPLVKAVKSGCVLVVDEADKAPTHVTCILKTLVESGEMHLSDGRRIVSGDCHFIYICVGYMDRSWGFRRPLWVRKKSCFGF